SRYKTDFMELGFLGKGGFASVYKVRNHLDGREYAIKKDKLEGIFNEIKTLAKLEHTNVVRYYSAWIEGAKGLRASDRREILTLMIMMSLHPFTLKDFLNAILKVPKHAPPDVKEEYCWHMPCALLVFKGILEGAEYLHRNGVVHRDLKPGNIFLNIEAGSGPRKDGECRYCDKGWRAVPKIGDFGLVAELCDGVSVRRESAGKEAEDGEEIREFCEEDNIICPKTDVYALGIILFELLYRCDTVSERVKCLVELREG
ncbi:kinase-like domain-containing protein, partial [Kalaharituber pfeilii]